MAAGIDHRHLVLVVEDIADSRDALRLLLESQGYEVAAVANGGTFYRPQLVEQVGILGEAPSYVMTPEVLSEVSIRTAVLNTVREGLCAVVQSRAGTAEFQFHDSELLTIGVCGKTGTAQNRPGAATHAWFAAYAPMNNPEIAIAVIVENGGEGSGVAAPIVRDILEYYFFERPR